MLHKRTKRGLTRIAAVLLGLIMTLSAGCARKSPAESAAGAGEAAGKSVSVSEMDSSGAEASGTADGASSAASGAALSQMDRLNGAPAAQQPDDLYRTCYEVFVYSFYDSNGDGIGDLPGLLEKLDYINDGDPETGDDLACSQLWTLPVFPSPTYHKYDVTDYQAIDPVYGTMADFDTLLAACHERGIRWILDLPLNHTSTEHPWFREAAAYLASLPASEDPVYEDCPYVWYYNFSREKAQGYAPLKDTDWYYEAQFWEGMPDLNLSTEAVRGEIADIARFWLEKGVDGFRLDAVTSYYTSSREASVDFLKWFREIVHAVRSDAYLVGEAWENQNVYAQFYESGIDSLFDFAFAGPDGLIAQTVKGSRNASGFAEALAAEEELYASYYKDYVNAPFYTNHDMARSTGYYAYDDGRRTKLSGALNLLMTGNAFVYYGEELGLKGSGKDENKRAPMPWTAGTGQDAAGMCVGPPGMDPQEAKFGSLADQAEDPYSVWNYYRNAIRIRNSFPVIARGRTVPVSELSGKDVGVFIREAAEAGPAGQDSSGAPYESVMAAFSISEETRRIDLAGTGFTTLAAVLTVSEEEVVLEGTTLILPPFAVAVLTA